MSKTINHLSSKKPVKSGLSAESGEIIGLMLFSRRSEGVTGVIRKYWVRRGVHWSASSLRLLLFLRLCGGCSVAVLQSWLGRSSMPMCYVKVSEGIVCRYGRGKGKLACYRLTKHGEEFVDACIAEYRELIAKELRNLPKKAREVLYSRAKKGLD